MFPICKLVAEAGWEPSHAARRAELYATIHVERFGENYLTVYQ